MPYLAAVCLWLAALHCSAGHLATGCPPVHAACPIVAVPHG